MWRSRFDRQESNRAGQYQGRNSGWPKRIVKLLFLLLRIRTKYVCPMFSVNLILSFCLLSFGIHSPLPIASWYFSHSLDDQRPAPANLLRPLVNQFEVYVVFVSTALMSKVSSYDLGKRDKLRITDDFTLWVRAGFDHEIVRPFTNHDTLLSRWGRHGDYSFLLRSDHHTKTLCLFLSSDGKAIQSLRLRISRRPFGKDTRPRVVVRMNDSVTFFVDGGCGAG